MLWFFVAYVVRFCVNLLIEPQVNPIKHFPVVTVSHKLLWPFASPHADALVGRAHAIDHGKGLGLYGGRGRGRHHDSS